MTSAAYLRQQAESLVAMSRATLDLGMAGRLRAMASEFRVQATLQEEYLPAADLETTHSRPVPKVS